MEAEASPISTASKTTPQNINASHQGSWQGHQTGGEKNHFGAGKLKGALKYYSYNLGIAIHN